MNKIPTPHGTDFAVAKEARAGVRPHQIVKGAGVVMPLAKKVAAPTRAGEDEGGERPDSAGGNVQQHVSQIRVSTHPITKLKLKGLTHPGQSADRKHSSLWITADEIPNEEVARFVFLEILGHGEADEEVALGESFVFGWQ